MLTRAATRGSSDQLIRLIQSRLAEIEMRTLPTTDPDDESGTLAVCGDALTYTHRGSLLWSIPIRLIRLVGEYTTQAGPWFDDYYFVFVTSDASAWFQASFYASGRDRALNELAGTFGHALTPSLCNSADFKSRVMWPAQLEDHPLFSFTPEPPASGVIERIRQHLLPKVLSNLTEEVQQFLSGASTESRTEAGRTGPLSSR